MDNSQQASMQLTTPLGQTIPQEILREIIRAFVGIERPISNASFWTIFEVRAIKAAKFSGWSKDAVSLFYQANTVRIAVPNGLIDARRDFCPGSRVDDHEGGNFNNYCDACKKYRKWYPAAGMAKQIRNLEVDLSCFLDSKGYKELTIPYMFGDLDRALGRFFTLKNPRFDQKGMNMPPVNRYTRTVWQENFDKLENLKVVLGVSDKTGTGTLCLAKRSTIAHPSHLDMFKACSTQVYVKLRPKHVEVECRVLSSCKMTKCDCGCFEEFARVMASKIELK